MEALEEVPAAEAPSLKEQRRCHRIKLAQAVFQTREEVDGLTPRDQR